MKKEHFENGYCLEFAYSLQKKNKDLLIGLIGANYYDDNMEEEVFEASHAVVIDPSDSNYCYDCNGRRNISDINCLFNNNVITKPFLLPSDNIVEAESFLGEMEEEALLHADLYILKNKELFQDLTQNYEKYINENIKGNYNLFKNILKKCVKNEKNKDSIKEKIDQSIALYQRYHNNIKNHKKRTYIQYGMLKKDPYQFDIESCDTFENILDGIQKISSYNETVKYAKSFLRSYKSLIVETKKNEQEESFDIINETTFKLFNTIKNKKLSRADIAQKLRKVASFEDSEDLNNVLRQIIKQYSNTFEQTLEDIKESNDMKIIKSGNGKIYATVLNFEGSQEFGSPEWCISTGETYYEEYLEKIISNESIDTVFEEDSCNNESIGYGAHVFCWDFNVPEENNLRQYAISLSTASELTAAHDQTDEDIMDNIESILNEDLNDIYQNAIPYNEAYKKQYIEDLAEPKNCIESPDLLLTTCKNPLNMFKNIMDGNEQDIIGVANQVYIDQELLLESLKRFENQNEITATEMIADCIYFDNFIKKFVPYADNNTTHEDYEEEYEFHDEVEEENSNVCTYSVGDIYSNTIFSKLFKSISKIEQQIIFKIEEESFKELLHNEIIDIEYSSGINSIEGKFKVIKSLKSNILNEMSEFLLQDSKLNNLEKKHLTISHVFKSSSKKPDIEDDFIEMVKNNEFNVNKIFFNSAQLSNRLKEKIADVLNENTLLIEDVCQDSLYELSKDNTLLEGLNQNSCEAINRAIKKQHEFIIMTPTIFGNEKTIFDFPQRYKKLVDLGILDIKTIQEKLETSRISYGHLDNATDSNGKKIDIIDYICSDKNKIQNNKKIKKGI
jgi:hypothetical protein